MDACTVMKREKRHNASGISNEGMQFLAMHTKHLLQGLGICLTLVCGVLLVSPSVIHATDLGGGGNPFNLYNTASLFIENKQTV